MDCFVEEVRVEESVGTSLPKGCLGPQDFSCFFYAFYVYFLGNLGPQDRCKNNLEKGVHHSACMVTELT